MSSKTDTKLDAIVEAVRAVPVENFSAYGGGWPEEISTALLDAVFSMRAVYRSDRPGVGVYGRLTTFRQKHGEAKDDLALLHAIGEVEIERIMGSTVSAQRRKSVIAIEAARRFVEADVRTANDFRSRSITDMKKIYTSVRGLGWVTFEYFAMHLGVSGVKADTMIVRFVNRALNFEGFEPVKARDARALVVSAHEETGLGESLMHFDHALWLSESDRA